MRVIRNSFIWALALCWLGVTSARADDGRWRRAESEHFVVYSDGSENGLRTAVQTLEDFHFALEALTNTTNTEESGLKLDVYLLQDRSSLRVVSPNVGSGVLGFYDASAEYITAFAVYNNNFDIDAQVVLLHEYAHHFMLHRFPAAYPRWYIEGWAEFVSTTQIRDRRAIVGLPNERIGDLLRSNQSGSMSRAIRSSFSVDLLPIEQLLAPERFPALQNDEQFNARFYATSWLAASLIANRAELARALSNYVRALGEGGDPLESFQPAFGLNPNEFASALRAYVRDSTGVVGVSLPANPASVQITRLPASMDDMLLRVARMRLYIGLDDQPAQLAESVNRAATRYPNDPFVIKAAARVALLSEDVARARTLLEPLVAANASDAEALLLLGIAHLSDAAREGQTQAAAAEAIRSARRYWARGFRANPDYFPILFLYARSFGGGSEPMAPEHLDVMARALYLAPQATEIRLAYAEETLRAGRRDETVEVLRPLLYSPHNAAAETRARALFEEARRN